MLRESELGPAAPSAPKSGSGSANGGLFSSSGKRTVVLCLLLALLTLCLYNSVIHNGFINLDDNLYVTDNPNVTAGLHWRTFKWALLTCEQANWHPLTWLSHALDWQLFKKNPAGHHYTSVLFHALDVVLLFLLFQKATGCTWRSLMVAALFAVHPANVESVAWIAERKNVLSMMFFLLAMLAYGWYARQPSLRRCSLVPLLFALGLMAKPQVITLPCVLLVWDYWPLQRLFSPDRATAPRVTPTRFAPASFRWLVWEKVPLFLLAAADALITMHAQRLGGAVRTLTEYSRYARLGNAIVSYVRYVGHAFWPFQLSPSYSHPGDSIATWHILAALLFLLGLTALVWVARKRYLLAGWLWFLGTLVPMIGIVQVGNQAMAERYAYIPFIGLFWMATWLLADTASGRRVNPRWLAVPSCLLIAGCCLVSHRLLGYWHDSEALWSYAIRLDDQDFMAHANLGKILVAENRPDEAISQFIIAERLHRYEPWDVLNFVGYELRKGRLEDAKSRCLEILRLTQDPHLRDVALTDLGVANLRLGDLKQAKLYFEGALQVQPRSSGGMLGLGLIAEHNGDFTSAIDYFSRAVSIEPNHLGYLLLAAANEQGGHIEQARIAYAEAQRLSPEINSPEMRDALQLADELLPHYSPSESAYTGATPGFVAGR